jgi:hypothetical protein
LWHNLREGGYIMDSDQIRKKIDELLAYHKFLQQSDKNELLLWEEKNILHEQQLDKGLIRYRDTLKALFSTLSQPFWTDAHYDREKCEMMLSDPHTINHAGLSDIKAILTDSVHQEEYANGYWITLIKNGIMLKIMDRLQKIKTDL